MDPRTTRLYERHAEQWITRRTPTALDDGRLQAFARRVRRGSRVVDLGCGPGWYADWLRTAGFRVVAVDIAAAMLKAVAQRGADLAPVRADLTALPFTHAAFDAAWAINCYSHLPSRELPRALADLQLALQPGAPVELTLASLEHFDPSPAERATGEAERRSDKEPFRGRLFTAVTRQRARTLLEGAGFDAIRVRLLPDHFWLGIRARRARTLPDLVGPGLRLLICGLNPSVYSADIGVPFGRNGNRFWPAARRARLIVRERDPLDAFRRGIGFTDLVKRASAGAAEIRAEEYRAGIRRIEALVRRYQPGAVCFVGLDGWRAVVDRRAQPGWIAGGVGGRPAYLMPSTSGRNARVPPVDLAAHLRTAAARPV